MDQERGGVMIHRDKPGKKAYKLKNQSDEGQEEMLSSGLHRIRKQVDRVDEKILELLDRRFSLIVETVKYKSRLRDKAREKEVFARVEGKVASCEYLDLAFARKIYRLILWQSLALEKVRAQELARDMKVK